MNYIIDFDICGSTILAILFLVTVRYRRFPTIRSLTFQSLVLSILIGDLMNLICALALERLPLSMLPVNIVLSVIHIFFVNIIPIFYVIFIHTLVVTHRKISCFFWMSMFFCIIVVFILTVTSPFTHFVMYFDADGNYQHGPGMTLFYIAAVSFMTAGIVDLIIHKKRVPYSQLMVAPLYVVATIGAIIFQYFHPAIMIIGFVSSISMLLVFFTLQNPGAFRNTSTGTFNLDAFKEVLIGSNVIKNGSVIIFKMTKTNKIKDLFGIESRYYITRQFMAYLSRICDNARIFYLFNDTYVIPFKKKNLASVYANKIYEATLLPFECKTNPHIEDTIDYPCSGRQFVVNDFSLITFDDKNGKPYSIDKVISIINFIATSYYATMNIVTRETLNEHHRQVKLQQLIQKTIENEDFEVFMQPIWNLKEKKFTAVEALLRLKDENGEYIPPLAYIPDAEKNGDILKISDIMMNKTCQFIKDTDLFNRGIEHVNVNLSMVQCMQEGTISHIIYLLTKYEIPVTRIHLELTETIASSDEKQFARVIEEMERNEIKYALDDYGTGYSNTAKMLQADFSEIKFDKSVIDAALGKNDRQKVMEHLILLSKEKNMVTIAEGIETKETADILENIGCDLIQGFYFARPMCKDDFLRFLDEHNQ